MQAMVTRLLQPRRASPTRPTPPTRSRWRCATGGARRCAPPPVGRRRRRRELDELAAARRGRASLARERAGDRVGAGHGARAHRHRRGARRGRRRRLPRARAARRAAGARTRAAPRSSSRTCTCARTRWCSTASRRATSATRSRCSSPPPASARSSRSRCSRCTRPTALRRALLDDDLAALTLVPGVGKRTAQRLLDRAEGAPRRARARPHRAAATAPSPRAEVRAALTGLGYAPDEVRDALARSTVPATARSRTCCATRSSSLAVRARDGMRDELLRAGGRSGRGGRGDHAPAPPPRRVRRPAPAQGAPRDPARRGAPARARPSTTCCSPARPGSARPRSPASSPPRWTSACGSRAVPRSSAPATSPRSSPTSTTATCCSSTRSTACPRPVEEVLYPAMEDFQLDIVIGKGPSARSIRLDLPALHARRRHHPHRADHRPAARPLRVRRPARLLRARRPRRDRRARRAHPRRAARATRARSEIARRARGTPRIANRLLKRVRDYAEVRADGAVTGDDRARRARAVRGRRARPRQGRPRHPRARCATRSAGSRSGSHTLAVAVAEEPDTVEEVYEPFLLKAGPAPAHPAGPGGHAAARTRTSGCRRRPAAERVTDPELFEARPRASHRPEHRRPAVDGPPSRSQRARKS